ncbi:MAG: hypothetical protein A2X11_02420 [Bacteroidetes bacterium GWE2_42_24]|nr:MAG: hypothetical protein A2X11_02420 [Bacteroidetes bacterium GWE2_42_24]OFY25398.1 MAG: hypothetical protein A2X09_02895 [Bacteroidetes bacterium GWF2_43_11]
MDLKLDITVLYVEDENIFRTVLKEILEETVTNVVLADNGMAGLEAFEKYHPQIVITDIAMPRLNGLQMLKAIKKIQPEIRTVVTTSYSETEYFLEAIELGVNRFILKPFDRAQFKEIITDLVSSIDYDNKLRLEEQRRKKAEEALTNSELLFRTLISNAPQAIFLTDPVLGKVIEVNESASRLLGYTKEELTRMFHSDFTGKEQAEMQLQKHRDILESNAFVSETHEIDLIRKDGTLISTEVSEKIILFSDYALVMGIYTDLTERKKDERRLANYHQHLEQLVEQRTRELTDANLRLQEQLEARERAGKQRMRRSGIEKLMLNISSAFINQSADTINTTIDSSLQKISKLNNAGKAFVWLLDETGAVKRSYYYLKEGLAFQLLAHKGFVINELPLIWKSVSEGNYWAVDDLENLTKNTKEYQYLSGNGVSSAIFCPINNESGLAGVIGLMAFNEKVIFDSDTVFLLNMAGKILANAFLRHESAIALISSEEKAHALLNASTASMVLFDIEGVLLEVNESAAEALNMPVNELIGKNYFDLHPSFIAEKRWPVIQQVAETATKTIFRDSYKNLSFEHLIYPIINQHNKVDRIAMMTREITSYVDAQNQIRNQYNFLQTLINSLPNPVYYKDANDQFIGLNKEFLAITGKSRQEIIGRKFVYDEINEFDKAINLKNDELKESNPIKRFEAVITYVDGTNHTVLFNKSLFYDVGGRIGGTIGVLIDITELKRFEYELKELNYNLETRVVEELRRTEKQQNKLIQKSKIESLGQLAAGMAHEINQPLGGISMSLENILLKQNRANLTDDYLVQKIEQCFENISRIKQIIDHIRTFSRDQQNSILERVNLLDAISNTLLLIEAQFKNHHIQLEINHIEDSLYFNGNKYKLEQVILNLLSNAKDALEEKEKLTHNKKLEKKVIINCLREGAFIIMTVADNGTGIEQDKLDNLFEPFYTTKATNKGTGLGLSIVYGIIKEFNGNINIDSTMGEGTVVEIILPSIPL